MHYHNLQFLSFTMSVSLPEKNCFEMNVMFTFQWKIFQLCPQMNVMYTTSKVIYSTFVGNTPIVIRDSLGKGSCLLTTFLYFLICSRKP